MLPPEWWAVCEDQSYLKLLAFHRTVLDSESKYRQDIVAGNMQRAIEAGTPLAGCSCFKR